MSSRRTSSFLLVAAVAALALIAAWPWKAPRDGGSSSAPGPDSRVALPALAPGPALGVVPRPEFGVRLSCTIRTTAAQPIAGARVCAMCADCLLSLADPGSRCVETDAAGAYALDELDLGRYRLTAGAPGYEPALVHAGEVVVVDASGLRRDGFDGTLEQGGALVTGTVMDGTGGAVAEASVEAHFSPPASGKSFPLLQTTTADADGRFSIWVPRGGTRFIARADGYSPGDYYTDAPATDVRLVMMPESGIAGHVVHAQTGQPVANVRVNAERRGVEQSAVSDDEGAFHITGLGPGTFNLTASGKGWLGQLSGSVTIDIGEDARDVLVHVYPAVAVRGLLQVGDEPCTRGKAVLVPAPGEALPRAEALTDREGRVTFEAVLPGRYRSGAACEDYGHVQGADVEVASADVDGLVWRLDAGATVTVVATTAGIPAERTWIELQDALASAGPDTPEPEPPHAGWTDDKGEIRFHAVRAADYRVQGPDLATPVPVTVAAGDNRFEVAIDGRGYLDVSVATRGGEPNDDVGVFAVAEGRAPGQATRIDSGRYRVGPLEAGEYDVQVRDGANPGLRARAEVRAGAIAELALTYGGYEGSISGQVLDDARAPLANVWVTAEPMEDGQHWTAGGLAHDIRAQHRRVATDADGRFEIPGLETGATFEVVATRRLGGEQRVSGVHTGQRVELLLASTATLAGTVVDENGEPVRHFRLGVDNAQTRQTLSPIFGPESGGRFRVDEVTGGTVVLTAATTSGGQASQTIEVSAGQELVGIELRIASMQAQNTELPASHSR